MTQSSNSRITRTLPEFQTAGLKDIGNYLAENGKEIQPLDGRRDHGSVRIIDRSVTTSNIYMR